MEGAPPAWIVPLATDWKPNPTYGYVVSFIRHHECGFTAPASCFMRGLCYHYGVELHNFAPNAISQAATFVGVCEGFLGIPVNWDLWVHLFRAELHTLATGETQVRRAVRASGLSITLRDSRKEWYLPCTMTSNNTEWERGWFYLRNDSAGLPLHWQGAEGEDRRLASQCVSLLTPRAAGVAPQRAKGSGRRRTRGGLGPRQPSSPADRPPHGEGAMHFRDDRGGRPYDIGALVDATRAFSSGVCGDEGEARSQP
jgi:hypothetical protein